MTVNWPFLGHDSFGQLSQTLFDDGRWPAVALFSGSAHLGKYTVAEWLVQRDLCEKSNRPCGTCPSCRQLTSGVHPRVVVLDGRTERIGVDQVLNAIGRFRTRDVVSRWILIRQAEALTENAANALLKILEEPPANLHFILTCASERLLLPTLRSRAFVWRFHRVSPDDVPDADRQALADADGRPGLLHLRRQQLDQREQEMQDARDILNFLSSRRPLVVTDERHEERFEVETDILRQVIKLQLGGAVSHRWLALRDQLEAVAEEVSSAELIQRLVSFAQRSRYLTANVSSRFVYDTLHH